MKEIVSLPLIKKSQGKNKWDFGNKVLYDLCSKNYKHNEDDKILAKVWLIGRAYSVAVERRRNKNEINDNFYINTVAPKLRKSRVDEHLGNLKNIREITLNTLPLILAAHNDLTSTLRQITDQDKRSFSSKYLHFHLPDLFFIYDSRAESAIRRFVSRVPKELQKQIPQKRVDKHYANFVYKCFQLKCQIFSESKVSLSPRQLDNLLIEVANTT